MSNYTLRMDKIIFDDAVKQGSIEHTPVPVDLEGQIKLARKSFFNFNYPIFDESYREIVETNFLRYFHEYEIGQDTVARFKTYLQQFMLTEFPKMNPAYKFQKEQAEYLFYKDYHVRNDEFAKTSKSAIDVVKKDTSNTSQTNNLNQTSTDTNTGSTNTVSKDTVVGTENDTKSGSTTTVMTDNRSDTKTINTTNATSESGTSDSNTYVGTSSKDDFNSSSTTKNTGTEAIAHGGTKTDKTNFDQKDDVSSKTVTDGTNNVTFNSTDTKKSTSDNKSLTDTTADGKVNTSGDVNDKGTSKELSYGWSDTPWSSILQYATSFRTIDEMLFDMAVEYGLFMMLLE